METKLKNRRANSIRCCVNEAKCGLQRPLKGTKNDAYGYRKRCLTSEMDGKYAVSRILNILSVYFCRFMKGK